MSIHDEHTKRCIRAQYDKDIVEIHLAGDRVGVTRSDIDLWHCLDCDTDFMHNWGTDTIEDIKAKPSVVYAESVQPLVRISNHV